MTVNKWSKLTGKESNPREHMIEVKLINTIGNCREQGYFASFQTKIFFNKVFNKKSATSEVKNREKSLPQS